MEFEAFGQEEKEEGGGASAEVVDAFTSKRTKPLDPKKKHRAKKTNKQKYAALPKTEGALGHTYIYPVSFPPLTM
jgi:hypothetical protein